MVNVYDKFLSVLLRLVKWPFNSLIPYRKVTYETFKSSKNHYMHCYRNSKNHPKTKTIYIFTPIVPTISDAHPNFHRHSESPAGSPDSQLLHRMWEGDQLSRAIVGDLAKRNGSGWDVWCSYGL